MLNVDTEVCEDRVYRNSMFSFAENTENGLELSLLIKKQIQLNNSLCNLCRFICHKNLLAKIYQPVFSSCASLELGV